MKLNLTNVNRTEHDPAKFLLILHYVLCTQNYHSSGKMMNVLYVYYVYDRHVHALRPTYRLLTESFTFILESAALGPSVLVHFSSL